MRSVFSFGIGLLFIWLGLWAIRQGLATMKTGSLPELDEFVKRCKREHRPPPELGGILFLKCCKFFICGGAVAFGGVAMIIAEVMWLWRGD